MFARVFLSRPPHTYVVGWFIILACESLLTASEFPEEQIAFFEKKIRPVLVDHCYGCHSAQSPQVQGGLQLDTRLGVLRGGESGEVVVPGKPESSLLMRALRYEDEVSAMPPKKQLPKEVIADFERWIAIGLPDPRDGEPMDRKAGIDIEKGRQFWAFRPPVPLPLPQLDMNEWPWSQIDHWVAWGLEQKGLLPVEEAKPEALIRRMFLDLIGLPPSAEEVISWRERLNQERDSALDALVDELLASPHFGERWGRHWLDVVRFAETSGRQTNFNYPHAWRYRDWVIDAFNDDLPYDQFVRMQIAGDLLESENEDQRAAQLIATGLLAIGPKVHSERNRLQFDMDLVDEQIDVTSQAFLGLTVACARCHDHKFDPIPQRDYYAIAGIFRSTQTLYGTIRVIQSFNESPLELLPVSHSIPSARKAMSQEEWKVLEQQRDELKLSYETRTKEGRPTTGAEFNQLATWTAKLNEYEEDGTPKRKAMAVRDRDEVIDCPLYERGEIDKPLEQIPRGFLEVLDHSNKEMPKNASGRLELADWIVDRQNPLTARVFVNRVWSHLFGRGLVPSPDNFGAAGMSPDNQPLLDHLATLLMEDGWSIKQLLRRLVRSRVYQLSSRHDLNHFSEDPENTNLWRMSPKRIDAEVLRDSLLSVAGGLERTPPIGSPVALAGEDNSNSLLRRLNAIDAEHRHRAVYMPVLRDNVVESLALFDFADPSLVIGQRTTTTVPSQSLFLLNNSFVERHSLAAAQKLIDQSTDFSTRLRFAYLTIISREPSTSEYSAGMQFLESYRSTLEEEGTSASKRELYAWGALCQALIASGDFLYQR